MTITIKTILFKILSTVRKFVWSIILAYMLGVHNFYKGENKTPDYIITTEIKAEQEDGSTD
jgi:hypothetical protein